ncbi:alpha/beta hydrolase [Zobellia uliginosa]|uniref:alpha/beta hydrolase n=1 Tax=Zobellia uliginosa TaxID=143224 RepID=UPI0026E338BC|nr:alpha/beta hydrolase [Zobellia uliginosa]MDO6518032.1 alpha/beta hydrolase [Zobellia uliginosa]
MDYSENTVSYTTTNSYATLNTLTDNTKNVWVVLHGIGYLSRYFLRYFDELPPEENYIIAPQAPSKYYLKNNYRHVGASWLTKEATQQETQNVIAYLDAVYAAEKFPEDLNFIVFGYSQGVSVATRWVAQKRIPCDHLVLYAGGIPEELQASDFEFLIKKQTKVTTLVGDADEYLTEERQAAETKKIEGLFGGKAKQISFKGGHEIKKELILNLVK